MTGASSTPAPTPSSETGPTGYTASGWSCTGAATSTATSVDLAPGENATCTITNTAIAPTLTLVKTVVNTGRWHRRPRPSGRCRRPDPPPHHADSSGDPAVPPHRSTPAPTPCRGQRPGRLHRRPVDLHRRHLDHRTHRRAPSGPGRNLHHHRRPPATLTLVKTVTNDDGGTAGPEDWTLTATGPTTEISRPDRRPAVTATPVDSGTYTLERVGWTGRVHRGRMGL